MKTLRSNMFPRTDLFQGWVKGKALAQFMGILVIFMAYNLVFGQGNWEDNRFNPRTWTTGKVGIGTGSPLSLLDIKGVNIRKFTGTDRGMISLSGISKASAVGFASIDFLYNHGTNPTARIAAFHDGSGAKLLFGTSNNYALGITNTAMAIDASGYVGIGTDQPLSKLHISGGNVTLENGPKIIFTNVEGLNDGTAIFREDPGLYGRLNPLRFHCTDWVIFDALEDSPFQIRNSSNVAVFSVEPDGRAYFNNSGNVGVGTTNPQSKLAVNGKITCTEVEVTVNGWSDFVFEDNYQLMPLKEVEQHIQENKHLPDIPSEKDVLENGLDLGKMQAKLLQKVEELTLYMIV